MFCFINSLNQSVLETLNLEIVETATKDAKFLLCANKPVQTSEYQFELSIDSANRSQQFSKC